MHSKDISVIYSQLFRNFISNFPNFHCLIAPWPKSGKERWEQIILHPSKNYFYKLIKTRKKLDIDNYLNSYELKQVSILGELSFLHM